MRFDRRVGPFVRERSSRLVSRLNAGSGMQLPSEPVLFFKATSSLAGPKDALVIPRGAEKVDWEVELAVIIEKKGQLCSERTSQRIPPNEASS